MSLQSANELAYGRLCRMELGRDGRQTAPFYTPDKNLHGFKLIQFDDLEAPKDHLPPTNGVRMFLEGGTRIIIRPSGTEPKIKCYIEVVTKGELADAKSRAGQIMDVIEETLRKMLTAQ